MLKAIKPKMRTVVALLFIPVVWYVFSVFVQLLRMEGRSEQDL